MKPSWVHAGIVGLLALLAPSLAADNRSTESWALYEKGNAAYDLREYGEALQFYKEAVSLAGDFPEAEMAIGDIYLEEGEAELAIQQYDKAYNERKRFIVPDMQYEVLYKAAGLYELVGRYGLMEARLLTAAEADTRFVESDTQKIRSRILTNYFDKGLDRVLVLYSFDDSPAARAHARLGWYYYRTGRYPAAIERLLYALIYRVSQVNRYRHDRDVDYDFTTLDELMSALAANGELSAYAQETELYKILYYLAGASFAEGKASQARSIWVILSGSAGAGEYQSLSQRQLKSPFVEPLLIPQGR